MCQTNPRSWPPVSAPIRSGTSAAKSPRTPRRACVAWSSRTSAARWRYHRCRRSSVPEIRERLAQHHRVEQRLIGPLREDGRHRVCGIAEQRHRAKARRAGNRMPKMREWRRRQIVVGQRREYLVDQVGPAVKLDRIMSIGRSGLTKSGDHGKSNHHCRSEPPAGHRPRFPCSPMICTATSLSAMCGRVTSPCQLHQPVGSAGFAPTMSRTSNADHPHRSTDLLRPSCRLRTRSAPRRAY